MFLCLARSVSMATVPSKLLSLRNLIWFAAWGVSLSGVLRIHFLEDRWGHAICGAWGCGPPLSALVSYHGFWLLFILPMAVLYSRQLPPAASRRIGIVVSAISIGAILLLVVVDAVSFWQYSTGRDYIFQRGLFRLATYVGFPLIPMSLAGLVFWFVAARKVRQVDSAPATDPL